MVARCRAVIVSFQSHKLEKVCVDQILLAKKYGLFRAKLITRRLNELEAAACLEDMRHLPNARSHELVGDRKGTLAVDLGHPYRLIFEPDHVPIPRKVEGGLDWTIVTAIRILAVEDYHD
jgi:proteic killer suppression protein